MRGKNVTPDEEQGEQLGYCAESMILEEKGSEKNDEKIG